MNDYISKSSVCEILANIYPTDGEKVVEVKEINKAYEEIIHLPPAQPERKKGRWIVIVKGCKLTSYKCSECGRYIADDTGYDVKKDYPFCHCGADMREDTNEQT